MITYAQNFEDVLLERLFCDVDCGFYIDVGAWDPKVHSVTQHFYDKGWRGVNVEPIPSRYQTFLTARPDDVNLNVAVGTEAGRLRFFECPTDSALSTLDENVAASMRARKLPIKEYEVETLTLASIFDDYASGSVEFLKIDVEGFEDRIINNFDFRRYRPRALIIESTLPAVEPPGFDRFDEIDAWSPWEARVLKQGYILAYFDGLNRFYLREEDASLASRLEIPAGIFDHFTPYSELLKLAERDAVIRERDELIAKLRSEIDIINADRENRLQQILTLTEMVKDCQRANEENI